MNYGHGTGARLLALLCALMLIASACGSDDTESSSTASSDATTSSSDDTGSTDAGADGDSSGDDGAVDLSGESVEIFGAFSEELADNFRIALQPLIDESGIDVRFVDSPQFDTEITTRVEGGNLPDISIFPQPGLLLDIAAETSAVPVADYLDIDTLESSLIPGYLDAARDANGTAFGVPVNMNVKSALWYPKLAFDAAGYELPTTDVELAALEDQIIADGGTPWCIGYESGPATGWVGTDWIEEYMLRLHGPEVYDQWITNKVPFDSAEVRAAFDKYEDLWGKEGNVVGGSDGMLALFFGASPADLFTDPPNCWMHRQGNFITDFFPEDVKGQIDDLVGVTYFPRVEGGYDGAPVLAGGDLALLINDTPASRVVMEFLAADDFGESWAQAGGWLSPHSGFDASLYATDVERALWAIGAEADVLRFDGSDLMPGPVGTGAFWSGMVDVTGGQRDLDEVLASIDAAWP